VWWLTRSRVALDAPNARSLHRAPVPRTGGIGIHVGAVLAWMMLQPGLPWVLWVTLGALLAVSLADDLHGVSVLVRFTVCVFSSGLLAASLLHPHAGAGDVLVVALALAWMSNLYNFMDGSDGMAGGMAVIGFSFYGAAAWLAGSVTFALVNFSLAAAAAAFLVFNFHPARVFMGDVGSVPLGFLAGAFGVLGWIERDWPWWFPVLVFSPFIVDASVTLARRLARRERVWEAHRDHYYQRVVQLGWGHRGTALAGYVLMLACGALGLVALALPAAGQAAILAATALGYTGLIVLIGRAWTHRGRAAGANAPEAPEKGPVS
jgi:UDP-N-acetylmuramyl pentapeptide phosphotransferase/UDP-N-acetylglucosamine-1-phosphate transferase